MDTTTLALTTAQKTMTEPIDRSRPPAMSSSVIPEARIMSWEASSTRFLRLSAVRNVPDGAMIAKPTTSARRITPIETSSHRVLLSAFTAWPPPGRP